MFFNDDLSLSKKPTVHRGRKLHKDNYDSDGNEQNLVPVIKRNLTPDDHINKKDVDSYLLVDNHGQPRKVYIKRNVPVKMQSPNKQSKTLDYSDDHDAEMKKFEHFNTMNPHPRGKRGLIKPTLGNQSKRNFLLGGESSLICCLSSKSHR